MILTSKNLQTVAPKPITTTHTKLDSQQKALADVARALDLLSLAFGNASCFVDEVHQTRVRIVDAIGRLEGFAIFVRLTPPIDPRGLQPRAAWLQGNWGISTFTVGRLAAGYRL